jgi:cysteine synthase
MLQDLEQRGELSNGRGLVEPTSGNTGISLAAMASARGHTMRAVVPEAIPLEKKLLLRMAGSEVDVVPDALCPLPGQEGGTIGLAKTYARAQGEKYVMPNQYENRQNLEAHRATTGPEIWRQTEGRITHLFATLGTCGTVMGTGQFLREKNPAVRVVAVQPSAGHDIPGVRNLDELEVSRLFDRSQIDEILEVDYRQAYEHTLALCRSEGLLAGPSSGLVLAGALQVLKREKQGLGVMIFSDGLFKYVSNLVKHYPELSRDF